MAWLEIQLKNSLEACSFLLGVPKSYSHGISQVIVQMYYHEMPRGATGLVGPQKTGSYYLTTSKRAEYLLNCPIERYIEMIEQKESF